MKYIPIKMRLVNLRSTYSVEIWVRFTFLPQQGVFSMAGINSLHFKCVDKAENNAFAKCAIHVLIFLQSCKWQ